MNISIVERIPPPNCGSFSISIIVRVGSDTDTFTCPFQTGLIPNIALLDTVRNKNFVLLITCERFLGFCWVITKTVRKICSVKPQYSAALQPPMQHGENNR